MPLTKIAPMSMISLNYATKDATTNLYSFTFELTEKINEIIDHLNSTTKEPAGLKELVIEVGKFYLSRNGGKILCYNHVSSLPSCEFAMLDINSCWGYTINKKGQESKYHESLYDIISLHPNQTWERE